MKNQNLPASISISNEFRLPMASAFGAGDLRPGQIYAVSNDSRFMEGNFSTPLTQFAIGFKDPNDLEGTLEFFAPRAPVPGRYFEWKKWSNAEEFYAEIDGDDVRAIGADFKRVEYTRTDQTDKTQNKGLMIRVDLDQVSQTAGWQNTYVAKLMRRLLRNEIIRARTLIAAAGNSLAATMHWTANGDPDYDLNAALLACADGNGSSVDGLGFRPNRIGFGETAWSYRFSSMRGNANAAKFLDAKLTPAELATMLGVDEIRVSHERYQSGATAKSQIFGTYILIFEASPGMDIEDASCIKRFVSPPPNLIDAGQFVRPAGSLDVNVYLQQISPKLVDIYVEHYSKIVMTHTIGVKTLTAALTS